MLMWYVDLLSSQNYGDQLRNIARVIDKLCEALAVAVQHVSIPMLHAGWDDIPINADGKINVDHFGNFARMFLVIYINEMGARSTNLFRL